MEVISYLSNIFQRSDSVILYGGTTNRTTNLGLSIVLVVVVYKTGRCQAMGLGVVS
jgi:hypothetical protein